MDIKNEIISVFKSSLKEFTKEEVKFLVEKPENEDHGDYSSNIALVASKILKKNPLEIAEEIAQKLNSSRSSLPNIDKVEAVKPGFINFWVSKEYLIENLEKVLNKKDYGSKPQDLSKKVVVEYSSPNIAKPFTVGHLRSTIIGDAIANLLEANGWKVYRDNHLGDWGTQFGKQIYAIKTWGDEDKIEKSENPVKELVVLYIKFHDNAKKNPELEEKAREWFKKLEDGDSEARRLWKKCVDWSLKEFEKIYKVLGIKFTENKGLGYGESFFENKIDDVLKELNDKKFLKENEGAKLVFFEKDPSTHSGQAKYPPLMIVKKDGATLYATRDLATDKFRLKEYGKDVVVINEVGIEQTLYFKQLYELEKMLGWYREGQRIHKRHGHYRFKDEKMSTRKGNTIWLEDLLRLAEDKAKDIAMNIGVSVEGHEIVIKKDKLITKEERAVVTTQVAIGAIKWNDLKRSSHLDIVFDWNEVLNMQGDSGPYIQYTYARTRSILAKLKTQNSKVEISFARRPLAKLEGEEVSVLRAVNRFAEVVGEAGEKFAPNLLCNYLFDLAQKFNLFYQKHKIIDSENQDFRLALTNATGIVLKNGLDLLGIQSPKKM